MKSFAGSYMLGEMGMGEKDGYLSVRQAADFLSVSQRTIRRYIEQNILPAYRIPGSNTIRIKREDLGALLEPINPAAADRMKVDFQ